MRAATIRDGAIAVEEHPDPDPGDGRAARPRPRRRASTAPTCCSSRAATPRRPARRRTSPGSSWRARWSSVGPGVERFEPGDRVMSIVAGGGQAELAVVHERTAMPVPEELEWTAAGGVPEVFTTAHDALFTQAGLRVGERLLVHGAAGGVGMAAVQLGPMAGARVTATVRNESRATQSTRSTSRRSSPTASRSTGRSTSSSSSSAGPTCPANLDALATGGRIVRDRHRRRQQGRDRPARADGQARAHPRVDAARPPARGQGRHRALRRARRCCPGSSPATSVVPVAATYPLDDVADAYERFQAGGKLGKIVLVP